MTFMVFFTWLLLGMFSAGVWAAHFGSQTTELPQPRDVRWMLFASIGFPLFMLVALGYGLRWLVSDLWPVPKPKPWRESVSYRESAK